MVNDIWVNFLRFESIIYILVTNGKNVGEAIVAITLGILGGLAAVAIINYLLGSRCPVCNNQISQGIRQCPHCNTLLEWR